MTETVNNNTLGQVGPPPSRPSSFRSDSDDKTSFVFQTASGDIFLIPNTRKEKWSHLRTV